VELVALYHKHPDFEMEMLENQQVQNNKILLKLPLIKKPDIFFNIWVSFNKQVLHISYWSLNKMYCAISLSIEIPNPETSGLED
jgi:hypothetical protein